MTRQERLQRSWAIALASTGAAAASHALAGGQLPSIFLWGFCTAFAALLCLALGGKRLSRLPLALAVAGSQLIFHTLYNLQGTVALSGPLEHHVAQHEHLTVSHGLSHQHGLAMLLMHLLAAVATYCLIRRADLTVDELARTAQRPWKQLINLLIIPQIPVFVVPKVFFSLVELKDQLCLSRPTSRGPPLKLITD